MKVNALRRFVTPACILAALLLFASVAVASETGGDVRPEKNAIVAVHVDDEDGVHVATGSGMVVDDSGLVATSCRLVSKWIERVANTISVEFSDGSIYPLQHVISTNCANNIVIIRVDAHRLQSVNIASSFKPRPGEKVRVISALSGAKKEDGGGVIETVRRANDIFQLGLPLTPAYDGSTVSNLRGEVVGMVTFPGRGKSRHIVIPSRYIARELDKCKRLIGKSDKASTASARSAPSSEASVIRPEKGVNRLEKNTRNAREEFLMACSHEKAGMYKEAIEAYKKAVRIDPDYVDAYVNLGLVYYKVERYPDAIDAYKQALRVRPGVPSIYNKLAATYIIAGDYSSALKAFRESVKIDPGNSETHFNLGVACLIAGDKDGAVDEYFILRDSDEERAEKLLDLIF